MNVVNYPRRNPLKGPVYLGTKRLYALANFVPTKNRTPHVVDGRPLVVIHNPKAAGSTLKAMLGAKGTTHTMPRLAYSRAMWRRTFSVVAVRHPFDRFVSGFAFMINKRRGGVIQREMGDRLAGMDPFTFLTFIQQYPEKLGHQVNWSHHPDPQKPTADVILKVEESADWFDQLSALGVPVTPAPERLNPARSKGEKLTQTLGLDEDEVARLEEAVFAEYREDYEAYGYERDFST